MQYNANMIFDTMRYIVSTQFSNPHFTFCIPHYVILHLFNQVFSVRASGKPIVVLSRSTIISRDAKESPKPKR